jgi:hypothetical protein
MAITLTADVGTSDPTIFVSEPLALGSGQPPQLIMVGAEAMYVANPGGLAWSVLRGANLTSPASHSAGDTVTPTSTAGQPSDVGVIGGVPFFVSDTDPTTVPALAALVVPGAVWIDTSFGPPFAQNVRGVSTWQSAPIVVYSDTGQLLAKIVAERMSMTTANVQMETWDGDGNIQGSVSANPTGVYLDWQDGTTTLGLTTAGISSFGLLIPHAPTADPAVAGALWSDPAAGHVLKVSQGA